MSWLRQGFTQSISGGISQLSGQLKDILTEGTEDIIDPQTEVKSLNEKIKEYERHIELVKMESSRWQEEANELNVKCQTYETQLEFKNTEYRNILMQKETQIYELTKQISSLQKSASSSNLIGMTDTYQKSTLMEDFEELVPPTEFSDYIYLQKEIKRLNEDNLYFSNENKHLINRLRALEAQAEQENSSAVVSNEQALQNSIAELKQEIFAAQTRLEKEKDKHQEEIIAIQQSYKDRVNTKLNETQIENESLKTQLNELQSKLAESTLFDVKISSSKSDDGWCINDIEETNPIQDINEKTNEILNLKSQIGKLELELDEATKLISIFKEKSNLDDSSKQLSELNETLKSDLETAHKLSDSLSLELKQLQQSINQEKLIQLQEEKHDKQSIKSLTTENAELKLKLDEKSVEINSLCDQVSLLNENINSIKSNDSTLIAELEQKTQQFLVQLESANTQVNQLKSELEHSNEQRKQFEFVLDEKSRESSQLKLDVKKHLQHIEAQSKALEKLQLELKQSETTQTATNEEAKSSKEQLDELNFFKQQYNQIYGYLEQKNVESLNYYNEIQRLNVVLSDLNRELKSAKALNDNLNEQYENLAREFQLEQKIVDDLNEQTVELNKTLLNTTNAVQADSQSIKQEVEEDLIKEEKQKLIDIEDKNRHIIDQMQFQINQLIADKHQMFDVETRLNETIESYKSQLNRLADELNLNKENEARLNEQINQLIADKEAVMIELNKKLIQTIDDYEAQLKTQADSLNSSKQNEEQQIQRLSKELKRLKEHLVEMSDSYNKEAIQAEEREKQLRLALSDAQKNLQQHGEIVVSSSKENEQKLENLTQSNQELKTERDSLKDQLKKSEQNLSHQSKVTKNLELVLERLQNDKDNQHSIEVKNFQQTIKEQATKIYSLQRESKNLQNEIDSMSEALAEMNLFDMELKQKDDIIKQLKAQISTKDALIESLDKRINEIQKVNNSFIEKDIVKSLIIGYIKVNQIQEKKQVLKLLATMLNFTPAELEQAEAGSEPTKWFGLLNKPNTPHKTTANQLVTAEGSLNKSFTELFIQYVDRESKPKPNFTFDLSNSNLSHKKTDGAEQADPKSSSNLAEVNTDSSASAVKFFNQDLNLINRNMSSTQLMGDAGSKAASSLIATQIASPAVANSFLEQILK